MLPLSSLRRAIGGSVFVLLSGSVQTSNCSSPADENAIHGIVSPSQHHIRSAYSKEREGFYIVYDARTRNPQCVVERLRRFDKGDAKETKRPPFFAESLIPFDAFRVHPKAYNDSHYDRGHMAPAADFSTNGELYEKTFTMANISPQVPALNQGFWSRFESWIRHFLLKFIFDEAIVITGPVFAPVFIDNKWVYVHRTIGTFPNLVQVPTHFFKVIVGKKNGSQASVVAAFLVPNNETVEKTDPIMNYLVKLSQLESLVGFRFFPSILDEKERDKLDIFVSEKRDLANVLNSKNIQTPARQLTWGELGNPKNNEEVVLSNESGKYAALSKRSVGSTKGFVHLCEFGVDCSRCMF